MTFVLTSIGIAAYIVIAVFVFGAMHRINEDMKQRKHYDAHPERFGVMPIWIISILSLLWPLQIIGILIYICKNDGT